MTTSPTPSDPIVRVRDLHKSFGATHVLRGLSLDISRGEKLVVIGTSGSGKSTLLRMVMALEEPTRGEIDIAGRSLWTMTDKRGRSVRADEAHLRSVCQPVGMVFQHFNLFPHLSVLDNIALAPVLVRGLARREAEARARTLLGEVGLADKASARPSSLSGGQKQRVGIARALAMQPEVILFDEVTSALDPELVGEVLEVMRRLSAQQMTLVIVTHQMRFARDIADRVIFMDQGGIVEAGPPDELFERPTQPRTQKFLSQVREAT